MIHIWHQCSGCKSEPLAGVRHQCDACPCGPDRDLCDACFHLWKKGSLAHPPPDHFYVYPPAHHHFSQHEGVSPESYRHWLDIPQAPGMDPKIENGFLVRPEVCSGYDSFFAGYGFAVKTDQGVMVLTALHVFDELIKKHGIDCRKNNTDYTGREIPEWVDRVNLYDVMAEKWMMTDLGSAGPMLVLPEARTDDEEPFVQSDLAGFLVKNPEHLTPKILADHPPQVGEPVWLGVKNDDGRRVLKAVVVEQKDGCLVYRYDEKNANPEYSSGAPVLNGAGDIVGVNTGGGLFSGRRFGNANHVGNLRKHLSSWL